MRWISEEEYDTVWMRELGELRSGLLAMVDRGKANMYQIAKGTGLAYHTVSDFLKAGRVPTLRTVSRIRFFLNQQRLEQR